MKQRKKKGNGKFRRQRQLVAKHKLMGMTDTEAVLKAGYAPDSVNKNAWKIVRHPEIQSILTASCARVLAKHNKTFDDILEPFVRGLDAKIVVKMPQFGAAVVTEHADIVTQMSAAEHLVDLHRTKQSPEEERSDQGNDQRMFLQVNFIETPTGHSPKPVLIVPRTKPEPAKQSESPIPRVSFVTIKR